MIEEHPRAVRRDLIALGLSWADLWGGRLSVLDVDAILSASPTGSATHFALTEGWDVTAHLLANLNDLLALLVWSRSEDATKPFPRHKPEPITRPGQTPAPDEGGVSIGEFEEAVRGGCEPG